MIPPCSLHGTERCECCVSRVQDWHLGKPYEAFFARCPDGHEEFSQRVTRLVCVRCHQPMELVNRAVLVART